MRHRHIRPSSDSSKIRPYSTFLTDDMQYRKVGFACIARVYMYLHMCISSHDEQEKREDEWKTREKENGKKISRSTATFNRIFISFSSFALLFH